jgi:hypothetical protein
MSISVLFLIGRFLLVVPFVLLGVEVLGASAVGAGRRVWGAVGIVGAAGVVLGVWGDIAALVLGVAVIGGGILECRGPDADDATRFRLVGLLGAAMVTTALYIAVGAAIDFTITGPVLDLDLR